MTLVEQAQNNSDIQQNNGDQPGCAPRNKPAQQPVVVSTIFSGLPIPEAKTAKGGGGSKYPFNKLNIGESFFVTGATSQKTASMCSYESKKGKAEGKKFVSRVYERDGVKGIMVWRVS